MNRGTLMAILALDLAVAAASAYVLLDRVKKSLVREPAPAVSTFNPEPPINVGAIHESPLQTPAVEKPEKRAPEKAKPAPAEKKASRRNVTFSFNDPRAKRVSVIGTFNDWSPQLMKKDASHKWTLTVSAAEGRHAYNFVVDGKTIRDPSAKASENVPGRKIPASVLTVKGKP